MGKDRLAVDAAMKEVEEALSASDLTTHETEPAASAAEALGLEHAMREGRRVVRCTDKRYWRLQSGLE